MAAARGPALGAATRLLVLGSVSIFQPVHGYFLRRELISWEVDAWAHVHPGSIYNALRTLAELGLLEESESARPGGRATRTVYRLTADGERSLRALLEDALRATGDPTTFLVAVNLAPLLPRDVVVAAVAEHVATLEEHRRHAAAQVAAMLAAPETPDSATEVIRVIDARAAGEITWAQDFLARVRAGAYAFAGEEPEWSPTAAQLAAAEAAGVHGVAPWPPPVAPGATTGEG